MIASYHGASMRRNDYLTTMMEWKWIHAGSLGFQPKNKKNLDKMSKLPCFKLRTFSLTLFLVFMGAATSQAQTTRDVESWLTTSISQRFDYGLEFMLESEQRFSTGAQVYQRYELTPQLIWHYSPRYDFSLGYEENRQWSDEGEDVGGHEGFASMTLKFPFKQWLLTTRQRLQGGINDEDAEAVFFRQQTRLSYELPRLPFRLRPFIQDEWYLDLINNGGITENRIQLGISYEINRAWRAELYGMRVDQWDMTGTHSITPVVGINLNLTF
jgi:hypothetical protein